MGRDIAGRTYPDGGLGMSNVDELAQENEPLRERLSRLSEASLRISESLRSRLPAIMDPRKPSSHGSLPAP